MRNWIITRRGILMVNIDDMKVSDLLHLIDMIQNCLYKETKSYIPVEPLSVFTYKIEREHVFQMPKDGEV